MRYIYIDEAGTSALEPVTVVVGVIVHADRQWKVAERALLEAFREVPERYRADFHFHAKAVWGNPKFREEWTQEQRLEFLKSIMAIPRKIGLALSLGIVRRNANIFDGFAKGDEMKKHFSSPANFEHGLAFGLCLRRADKYINEYADENEIATVIAEDVPEHRDWLKSSLKTSKSLNLALPGFGLVPTRDEMERGLIHQEQGAKVTRIIDSVHFVEKSEAPLLQIADACAFGFRRFFARQSHGEAFLDAIGANIILEDWERGPMSGSIFFWHPAKTSFRARFLPVWRAAAP